MRTWTAVAIWIAIVSAVGAQGDAAVGGLEVLTGQDLLSEANRGQKGILVRVRDVEVRGSEGKLLRFVVAAYQEGSENVPTDYVDARASRQVSTWESLELELPFGALQAAFGRGSHDIYVIFYILDVVEGVPQTVPGSYHIRPLSIVLEIEGLADRHRADREANEAVLRSKVGRGPQYGALLEVAAAYDLTFVVRKFTIGSKATRELYSWQPLTDADDGLLDRYVETFVKEWVKLPVDFVEKTGLRAVVLAKDLRYGGVRVGGGFDVDDRFVICDVHASRGDEHFVHALLHEYMHIIDNLLCCRDRFDNEEWQRLNHPGAT